MARTARKPEPTMSAPDGSTRRRWSWRPKLQWFAAEFLVVVSGVLMALALNAWWAGQVTEARERIVLEDLQRDFSTNQAAIAQVQAAHATHQQRFVQFERLSPDALAALPPDSLGAIYGSLLRPDTFDPVRGATDALIASGDLGLLRDPALRSHLTAFLGLVDDAHEEQDVLVSTVLASANRMAALGGPWGVPGASAMLDTEAVLRLRQDVEFRGRCRISRLAALEYRSELERIAPVIDSVLARTEQALAR